MFEKVYDEALRWGCDHHEATFVAMIAALALGRLQPGRRQ